MKYIKNKNKTFKKRKKKNNKYLFVKTNLNYLFLGSLGSRLGSLNITGALGDGLDDTDGDGLAHITDGEAAERGIFGEGFNAERLGGNHVDHSGVTHLDELGIGFEFLTRTAINLGLDFGELASDVRSVAIEDGRVTVGDLTRVVEDDDLGQKAFSFLSGVVLGVGTDEATTDVLDGEVLDVEADVVTGNSFRNTFVMHLDRLDFCGNTSGGEGDDLTGLHDTGFNTADGDGTDTTDLVDVLEGKAERLVEGADGGVEEVKSFEESGSLVPRHVGGLFEHVVTVPAGDGDEADLFDIVTDLLEVSGEFLLDLFVTRFGVFN